MALRISGRLLNPVGIKALILEPTYQLTSNVNSVDEGNPIVFTLTTTNVPNGTLVPYTITGVTSNDIVGGQLTGNFTVNNNTANTTITVATDAIVSEVESMTMIIDGTGTTKTVTITDTTPTMYAGSGQPWRDQYEFNQSQNTDLTGWTTGGNMWDYLQWGEAAVTKNYAWYFGGAYNGGVTNKLYRAVVNSDGTLGSWSHYSNLPVTICANKVVVVKNRIHLIGGYINGTLSAATYTAPINSDGTFGSWTTGPSLPTVLSHSTAVVTKSRVYTIGGYNAWTDSGGVTRGWLADVYSASINTDGTLGTWVKSNDSLPLASYGAQVITTKNRVYYIGGNWISSNPSATNRIFTAPINGDGTIGSWTEAPGLPRYAAHSISIVVKNRAYMFAVGAFGAEMYHAPVNEDGTLGTWTKGSTAINVTGSTVIVTNSRIHLVCSGGTYSRTVYTAPFSGGLNDYSGYYTN